MSYLDVITLDDAKNHLRVDASFTEDDASISRMIISALQYIEKETSHIMFARDKTYYRSASMKAISVSDYPINNYPDDIITLHFSLMHQFKADKITLNVGYINVEDIPMPLIEAAYEMIDNMYYQYEQDGNKSDLSESTEQKIFKYKRGIVSY